jgi:hypothetical protein
MRGQVTKTREQTLLIFEFGRDRPKLTHPSIVKMHKWGGENKNINQVCEMFSSTRSNRNTTLNVLEEKAALVYLSI